jgi:hypothetical protein
MPSPPCKGLGIKSRTYAACARAIIDDIKRHAMQAAVVSPQTGMAARRSRTGRRHFDRIDLTSSAPSISYIEALRHWLANRSPTAARAAMFSRCRT